MKKNKFRFIAALLVAISLMSIPAYAEKIYFTITTPGDTYSRKATKADEEQAFYVTGVVFSYDYAVMNCYSMKEGDRTVVSKEVGISKSSPSKSAAYVKWAAPGQFYRLNGYSVSAVNFNVQGYYNP